MEMEGVEPSSKDDIGEPSTSVVRTRSVAGRTILGFCEPLRIVCGSLASLYKTGIDLRGPDQPILQVYPFDRLRVTLSTAEGLRVSETWSCNF